VGAGSVTLTGQQITAYIVDASSAITQVGADALILAGGAISSVAGSSITADAGSITLSGAQPTIGVGYGVQPGAGTIVLTGQSAQRINDHVLAMGAGALSVSGLQPSLFLASVILDAAAGSSIGLDADIAARSLLSGVSGRSLDADIANREVN
jgi:hypothetical protein